MGCKEKSKEKFDYVVGGKLGLQHPFQCGSSTVAYLEAALCMKARDLIDCQKSFGRGT